MTYANGATQETLWGLPTNINKKQIMVLAYPQHGMRTMQIPHYHNTTWLKLQEAPEPLLKCYNSYPFQSYCRNISFVAKLENYALLLCYNHEICVMRSKWKRDKYIWEENN